jgi:DNA polymerase-3 subunit delta'
MINHSEQWKQLQTAVVNGRIPQSLLFVGSLHCALDQFVTKLMPLFLCANTIEPCLVCPDCQMSMRQEHPDVEWVKPEKSGGAIKIDQIRELQNSVYLTPQRSKYRLIVIDAADRMNNASANALLKILEEPAKHTIFILIAQQLSTVLPTILSRCQLMHFSLPHDLYINNLLKLGEHYSEESERTVLMSQAESILDNLIALIEKRQHPCLLANQWIKFDLVNLLWFLYLAYAQLQNMHVNKKPAQGLAYTQLNHLISLLDPLIIFDQIDKINTLLRKISHNIHVNHTLALENLLFSLVSKS